PPSSACSRCATGSPSGAPRRSALPSCARYGRPSAGSASPRYRRARPPCADSARSARTTRSPAAAASRAPPRPHHAASPVLPVLLAEMEYPDARQRMPALEMPAEVEVVLPGRLRRPEADPEAVAEQLEVAEARHGPGDEVLCGAETGVRLAADARQDDLEGVEWLPPLKVRDQILARIALEAWTPVQHTGLQRRTVRKLAERIDV